MAFSEFDARRCGKLVGAFVERHRRPPDIRSEVDLAFRVEGQSVEVFESRAVYDDPGRGAARGRDAGGEVVRPASMIVDLG